MVGGGYVLSMFDVGRGSVRSCAVRIRFKTIMSHFENHVRPKGIGKVCFAVEV